MTNDGQPPAPIVDAPAAPVPPAPPVEEESSPSEPAQESGGGYSPVDGIIWVPAMNKNQAETTMKGWQTAGFSIAAVVLVVCVLLALMTDGPAVAFFAIGGALVLAALLVCVGIGMLHGEVLLAARPAATRAAAGELKGGVAVANADELKVLKDAMSTMTPGRAAIFAGVFIVVAGVISAGIASLGPAASPDEPNPSPSPTVSVTPE